MKSAQSYPLDLTRTLLYDGYWPPFAMDLAFDPKQAVDFAVNVGATAIRLGAIAKWAFYPSKIMPRHPDLGDRDLVGQTVAHAKKSGLATVMYIPVGHGLPVPLLETFKPTWQFRLDDQTPLRSKLQAKHFGGTDIAPICAFGDYEQAILHITEELTGQYHPEAVYLDGPYQGWDAQNFICQCSACRGQFEQACDMALPTNAEIALPRRSEALSRRVHAYMRWNRQKLLSLLKKINEISKKNQAQALLINRSSSAITGSCFEKQMLQACDGFLTEASCGSVEGFSLASVLDKVVWNYTNEHTHWPRFTHSEFEWQSRRQGSYALSLGGCPIVSYAGRFLHDDRYAKSIKDLFADSAKIQTTRPSTMLKRCCVITPSDERILQAGSMQLLASGRQSEAWCNALLDHQYQTMMMPSIYLDEIDNFKDFQLLVLSDDVRLSPTQVDNLQQWIKAGGKLLATGQSILQPNTTLEILYPQFAEMLNLPTTTCSQFHQQAPEHVWADKPYDLYLQVPEDWASNVNESSECATDGTSLLPLPNCLILPRPKAHTPTTKTLGHVVYWDKQPVKQLGLLTASHGKGQFLYIAGPLESGYERFKHAGLKTFLGNVFKHLLPAGPLAQTMPGYQVKISTLKNPQTWFVYVLEKEQPSFHQDNAASVTLNLTGQPKIDKIIPLLGADSIKISAIENQFLVIDNLQSQPLACLQITFKSHEGI